MNFRHLLEILIRGKADTTEWKQAEKDLKQISTTLTSLGKQMAVMGAAISGALGLMTKSAIQYASQLDATSKRTGVAVDELAKLGYAAEMEHANLQKLEMSFRYFSRTINQAQRGTGQAAEQFERLGIELRQQDGTLRPIGELWLETMGILGDLGDTAEGTAAAVYLMGGMAGRGAMEILPFIKANQDLVEAYMAQAEAFGLVLTPDQVQRFRDAEKAGIATRKAMFGLSLDVASVLVPALTNLHGIIQSVIQAFSGLPPAISIVLVTLAAVAGAYFAVSGAVILLTGALGKLVIAFGAVKVAGGLTMAMLGNVLGVIAAVAVGIGILISQLDRGKSSVAALEGELSQTSDTIKQVRGEISLLDARIQELTAVAEEYERQQHEIRLEMANRFGAALMSAIRKRYAEQLEVEKQGQEALYEQEVEAANRRLDAAREAHQEGLRELDRAISKEITALRRANEDKEREYRRDLDALIEAKRAEIDALDDAINEEDAQRRAADRERRRALLEEERLHTTYRPRLAEIDEELARIAFEEHRDQAKKEIEAQRKELEEEIQQIRDQAEEERIQRQRQFQDSLSDYQNYLNDLADGRDVYFEGNLTAEQEAFAASIRQQQQALLERWNAAEQAHADEMARLETWNQEELDVIQAKYDRLMSDYNVFNEAMALMTGDKQEEILELLNTYEKDWRSQGKSFVDMMIMGMEDEFPSLQAIAAQIGLVQRAAAEEVARLRQHAASATNAAQELRSAVSEQKRLLGELEAQQAQAEQLKRDIEARRAAMEVGSGVWSDFYTQQGTLPGDISPPGRAVGGWTSADQLEYHHAGELTLPAYIADWFKRMGIPVSSPASSASTVNNYFTMQAQLSDGYDTDRMWEDSFRIIESRSLGRVAVTRV